MIDIRCVHRLDAGTQRASINALNLASARPDPFSTFEFYEHCLRYKALFSDRDDVQLWLLLAFLDGEMVGYLALKRSQRRVLGWKASRIDWLTAHIADQPHPVTRPGFEEAVSAAACAHLLARRQDWSLLEFQQQTASSPLLASMRTASSAGLRFRQWANLPTATIPVQFESIAGYFAMLSKKFRSNVSRQMRSLMSAGRLEMLSGSDPDTLPLLFDLYREIERHSWKAHTAEAFDGDHHWIDYYRCLMQREQPMNLSIHLLLLDGFPVAGLINGAYAQGLYALHIVYDERLTRLAPGSAMLLMGIRAAIDGGYSQFDLLWGYGYYKSRWLAQMQETQSLQLYRSGGAYFWQRLLGDLARRWRPALPDEETLLFNPARRETQHPDLPSAADDPRQRALIMAMVDRAKAGRCEFLDAARLSAALPFPTSRTADALCAVADGS